MNTKAIDHIVAAVRDDLLRRSELGINKYGKTLDRTDLSLRDWLQHAYEENLDLCNYLKRCIVEIDDNEITKMMMQEPFVPGVTPLVGSYPQILNPQRVIDSE